MNDFPVLSTPMKVTRDSGISWLLKQQQGVNLPFSLPEFSFPYTQ
jgi:hypothetical protein